MIVADTNLFAYLLLKGEHTAAAEQVLSTDAEWAAPTLWRSEFRNVLALYLRRGVLDMDVAADLFRQAERIIADREFEIDTDRVLALVKDSDCAAYDCEFVALALALEIPLVTSDRKILATFPGLAVSPPDFAAIGRG